MVISKSLKTSLIQHFTCMVSDTCVSHFFPRYQSKRRSKKQEEEVDDWGEDTSEDAVAQRMAELSSAAKNMTMSEDVERTPQERVDMFYKYVKVGESKFIRQLMSTVSS